jgi:hypothetical protein
LRAPGAVAALQSALTASAAASAGAPAMSTGGACAVSSLLASMGFAANAHGAASASAAASAMSALTLRVPPITANFGALSMLAAVVALLASITSTLGVSLNAPNGLTSVRAALALLPLAGLARLSVGATAAGNSTGSVATAVRIQAEGAANAASALDLSALSNANLTSASQLAVLMRLTTQAGSLLAPPGSCSQPCPLAPAKVLSA